MIESDAITLLVPFPPGGSTDFTARVLAESLRQAMGWRVEVETRTGDSGYNAVRTLVAGPAHSVFLVGNINANSVAPVVRREEVDIDHWRVVRPVTKLADFPSVVCTHRRFPAGTLDAFLSRLKETARTIRYGTDFLGTYVDVDVIRLSERAGLDRACMTADGALAILADLEAQRTDLAILNVATATANAARLKPLAISGPSRLTSFPGVPTLAEAGYAGIGTSNWQALLASRDMTDDRVAAVHGAVVEAMSGTQTAECFTAVGATVSLSASPRQLEVEIEVEAEEWEKYAQAIADTPLLTR